jgi:hypothetical protein
MKRTNLYITIARRLERAMERGQQHGEEAYLAQATDHADLERRQRELSRPVAFIPSYG